MGAKDDIQPVPEVSHQETVHEGKDGPAFTLEEENRVYRKLDWNLMPLIFVLYSLSVLDRANLGNAKIAGMKEDIDLSGRRYDWLATVFYIACEYCSAQSHLTLTPSRHPLAMDDGRMESIPSAYLGGFCGLSLGPRVHRPGGLHQLGRADGLSRAAGRY